MKLSHSLQLTASLIVMSLLAPNANAAGRSPAGLVDFGKIPASSSGSEFVEVHVKSNLISMAARLLEKTEPEVAKVLRGLQLVRVNVVGLADDNRVEVTRKIASLEEELTGKGWETIVNAKQKNESVNVYVKTRGDEAVEGVVVTVLEGTKEAIFVNVVGDINPNNIALIGERLNIDPLKKLAGLPRK